MVTTDPIQIDADLVRLKTCSVFQPFLKTCSVFQQVLGLGWAYLATQGRHPFTSRSHPKLEIQMKGSHPDGI